MSENIVIAELKRWNSLDIACVIHGVTIYIDKAYHTEKKDEAYLWGIMRRVTPAEIAHERNPRASPNGASSGSWAQRYQEKQKNEVSHESR